jgi:GTP-binding protein EngB required for normal cell division
MQLTTKGMLSDVDRWGRRLASAIREYDADAAARIEGIVETLASDRVTVSVLGKAKRGKSTLVNALLGRNDDAVAPIDRLPASSCVSRFTHGTEDKATVTFLDGKQEAIPFERIREFVTEEGNPGNRREVRLLDISGRFDGIDSNVVLVDTPGAGSIHEHHDALLFEFIPQSDAVVFLMTARMPIDQDEKKLLGEIKKADVRRLFFVVNRIDESDPQDLADAESHARAVLGEVGISPQKYYRISAKRAFEGDAAGSGVAELLSDIRTSIIAARSSIVRDRTLARIKDVVATVAEALQVRIDLAHQSTADIDSLIEDLQRRRKEEMPKLQESLKDFTGRWDAELDDLFRQGVAVKESLLGDALGWVESAATLTLDSFARDLPPRIHAEWLGRMTPAIEGLQSKLAGVLATFEADIRSSEIGLAQGIRMAGVKDSALNTAMDMGQGGLIVAAGAGIGAIPSLVATGATGWIGTLAGWSTAPLWLVCGPVSAFVVAAGAFTAFQGWRLSKQRLRDRLSAATRDHVNGLLSNLQNEVVPRLRKEGREIAGAAETSLVQRREQIIKAVEDARAKKPSPEAAAALRQVMERITNVLGERPEVSVER